jgi:predicted enzyme related to lactoylglutathione lyase
VGRAVVHFEIIGRDPAKLRSFYGELFDWQFDVGDATSDTVSQPGQYGFVAAGTTDGEGPINGGVGGGDGFESHVVFYVQVPEVEAALRKAESLGGRRHLGPEGVPGKLMVGQFTDPEGNLVGVAGTR